MITWLVGGPPFEPAGQLAYQEDLREGNQRRLRIILPLMLFSQAVIALQFSSWGADRSLIDAQEEVFRDALAVVHGVSALGTALLWLFHARGGPRIQDALPQWTALAYFLHVNAVVGVDQLYQPKITVFGGAALAIAILIALPPRKVVVTYGVGLIAYLAAVMVMQPDPAHRWMLIQFGSGITAGGLGLALFLVGARRRDFRQSLLITDQQRQLEQLNVTLEQRVQEQVEALTRRAAEVERLNAQLQSQVRDRSRALAIALRRLAAGEMASDDLEGREVGGRFTLGPQIATGGMGAVYEGIDATTGDPVAVKVIRSAHAPLVLLERFLREAETAATITHPAVVRMLHVDIHDDGTFYQIQELVRGETLRAAVERHGRFGVGPASRVLAVLCEALNAAHERGVVHRDVKPANILLTREAPGLKLVDFGISKLNATDDGATLFGDLDPASEPGATRAGAIMGTPQFMSPEQQTDASSVSDRADLYALGVVAVLLLTGELPTSTPPGLQPLPEGFEMVRRCLSKDPDSRPSAAAMQASMEMVAASHGTRALHELVSWDSLRGDTGGAETLFA